jgi:hypothetical protein
MSKNFTVITLAAIAMLSIAACHKAESPAEVNADVAKAANQAATQDIKAEEKQSQADASANAELAKAEDKAESKSADAAGDAAITHAEGVHKVAIEQCEALAGDAQKACKDKADAALEMAKANAKAMKAAHN